LKVHPQTTPLHDHNNLQKATLRAYFYHHTWPLATSISVALKSITAKNQSWSVAGGTRRCRTSHYTHVITNCIRAPQMAPQSGPLRHLLAISCHLMHHNCHLTPINTVILHTKGHGCHLTNHYTVVFQPVTATLHTLRSSSHRSRNDARLNDAMCVGDHFEVVC
jgi:hypothetical protein